MPIGAFTGSFDLPLLLVIAFFLFFLGLVYHLRQEDKREGYPLVSHRTSRTGGRVPVVGFPPLPAPKTFLQPHGRPPVTVPRDEDLPVLDAHNVGNANGMPIAPRGPALGSGIGPGAWVARRDEPDLSHDGRPVFLPLRAADGFKVAKGDADPRGFAVLGLDGAVAGRVVDIWVDRSEHFAKFLEVALEPALAAADRPAAPAPWPEGESPERRVVGMVVVDEVIATPDAVVEVTEVDLVTAPVATPAGEDELGEADRPAPAGHVLLPMEFASVNGRARTVRTAAITAEQFAGVPRRRRDVILTAREENVLRGYYGGGILWATPDRAEPLL